MLTLCLRSVYQSVNSVLITPTDYVQDFKILILFTPLPADPFSTQSQH